MKLVRGLIACCTFLCSTAHAAEQTDVLLYRQAPGRTWGLPSDTAFIGDSGNPTSRLNADRFSASQSASLTRIQFWGFYGSSLAQQVELPPTGETFRVRIYSSASGAPDAIQYETFAANPSRVATGISMPTGPGPLEYLYNMPLSIGFAIEAKTDYWIEIAQFGTQSSYFRWEQSNTAGEYAFQSPVDNPWQLITGNGQMAYELWTPEPCSVALLGLGCSCLLRHKTWNRLEWHKGAQQ